MRDQVAQVYLGVLDWGTTGDVLRRRIDWMAGESRGPRVLDVGCSEGILEVLLARRGLDVTGVEVNPDALDFARELLAQEPDEARARARLIHGDFIEGRPVTGLFDTVVLGEILEHLHDPGALLDRSLEHLRPGGRVVITTPFGLHPHEDHHQTFGLTDAIDLLKPRLGLEQISIEDGYIRFVGRLSSDSEVSWRRLDADAVLSMTDAALIASQTKLYEMLSARGKSDRTTPATGGGGPGKGRTIQEQSECRPEENRGSRTTGCVRPNGVGPTEDCIGPAEDCIGSPKEEPRGQRVGSTSAQTPIAGYPFQHIVPCGFGARECREAAAFAVEVAL